MTAPQPAEMKVVIAPMTAAAHAGDMTQRRHGQGVEIAEQQADQERTRPSYRP